MFNATIFHARSTLVAAIGCLFVSGAALAQDNPFTSGWTLQPEASTLNFQSTKKKTVVETSSFATFNGTIDEQGLAEIIVKVESVDTKIDLRNVRMRFLFFESFQFPDAVIKTQITRSLLDDLKTVRRKTVPLPYTLTLHGVTKSFEMMAAVTLLSDDQVAVSTRSPISVAVADFGLLGGIQKLEEAAGVDIIPSAAVTFDFLFKRNSAGGATTAAVEQPTSAALEPTGQMDATACKGRFEILSRTNNIYFNSGSARLIGESAHLLNSLADIISRCPDMVIEVGGHTDSDGGAAANQRLSERRAKSVIKYLKAKGIPAPRMVSVGYGEEKPAFTNDTAKNKGRNRRIEFAVIKG